MKKNLFLLLFAGAFIFSSCSSDDDGGSDRQNSVLGTWNLVAMNPDVIGLDCPDPSVITFDEDGTADWTLYSENNNCEAQPDSGVWVQDSATQYTMTLPQVGSVTGTVVFDSATNFTFSSTYQNVPFTFTFEK